MTLKEFRELVGHLAAVLPAPPERLDSDWQCTRSFAVEQQPDAEPPLCCLLRRPLRAHET